ncbi:IS66-like element accessory protein TnpA [Roseivivax sediminis]|uniref:Transposase n=1 Tax=Roseivivax sediminis TaxID=936889 RepID=A0A1I2ELU7_9RHOB|nr:transposase [Roseivivax sediminis]SFE93845.1 transposase [Roseivivax sediminis]
MDDCLDGSSTGYACRMEVIEGRSGRRQRSEAERARIAAESLWPGIRVADVARRHGVTRWQVYDWRKKLAAGKLAVPDEMMSEPAFAALVVETPPEEPGKPSGPSPARRIELSLADVTLRVEADIDEEQLTRVIRAIRAGAR